MTTIEGPEPTRRPTDKEWRTELDQRAAATVTHVLSAAAQGDQYTEEIAIAIHAALLALADDWSADAQRWATAGKRGGKSTAAELTACGARLREFVTYLAARTNWPSTRDPEHHWNLDLPQPGPAQPAPMSDPATFVYVEPVNRCGALDPLAPAGKPCPPCIRERRHRGEPGSSHVNADGRRWPMTAEETAVPEPTGNRAQDYISGAADTYAPGAPALLDPSPDGSFAVLTPTAANAAGPVALLDPSEPDTAEWLANQLAGAAPFPGGAVGLPLIDPADPPRRLTFTELAQPVPDRPELRGARSVSQLTSYVDCGLAYRISHYHKDVPRRPQWSLVGGSAFHAAVELLEQGRTDASPTVWEDVLRFQIERTEAETGVRMSDFRAAAGGKEGYDWWRVEGADMLARYATWRPELAPPLAIEREFTIEFTPGGLPVHGVIDQIRGQAAPLPDPDPTLTVVDLKSGAKMPTDHTQLAVYRAAAWKALGMEYAGPVRVGYYLARRGEFVDVTDRLPSLESVSWRFAQMDAAERAGVYLARPSSFCSGCAFVSACPAVA